MRILLAVLITSLLAGCFNSDLKRLQSFAGVELPSNAKLVSQEDSWVSPNGEGHSLRVYKMPKSVSWGEVDKCELGGFSKAQVKDMEVRFPILDKHINTELPVCFKVEVASQREEVIFIQAGKILYYCAA